MMCYDPAESGFGEFFVYSSCHWLGHFGAIDNEHLPNLASIEFICEAGSTRLHNWIEQNCRPGCAIKSRFPFDSSLYDPLSITSLYGSESMLLHMLQKADFDHGRYNAEPAAAAADQISQWGDPVRLRLLRDSKIVLTIHVIQSS
jgi:hypothetical protein